MTIYPYDTEKQNLVHLLLSPVPETQDLGLHLEESLNADLSLFWRNLFLFCWAANYDTKVYLMSFHTLSHENKKRLLQAANQFNWSNYRHFSYCYNQSTGHSHFVPFISRSRSNSWGKILGERPFLDSENPFMLRILQSLKRIFVDCSDWNPLNPNEQFDVNWLSAVHCVQELHLFNYPAETLPDIFRHLKFLRVLVLCRGELSHFPDWLGQVPSLRVFKAIETRITVFPDKMPRNITHLDLSGNGLTALPAPLFQMRQLTAIDLSNNNLSEFPSPILQLGNLKNLQLKDNPFSFSVSEFWKLSFLKHLKYLSWCKTDNISLVNNDLHIKNINQTTEKWISLLQTFTAFKHLKSITISDCNISEIPRDFLRFYRRSLHTLVLTNNYLSAFPEELAQLVQLKKLDLSVNPIREIPDWIGRLRKKLEDLSLREIKVGEDLPQMFFTLTALVQLDIGKNMLKNGLPANFSNMKELVSLCIDNCNLDGIPGCIEQMTGLCYLDVSGNKITNLPPYLMSRPSNYNHLTLQVSQDFYKTLKKSYYPRLHIVSS